MRKKYVIIKVFKMDERGVKLYQPDAQIKKGWLSLWRQMFSELIGSRELIWRLFVRDFLAKYKQAVFGVAWALIMPLVMVGVFVFLNRAGVINIGTTDIPYPAFALLGLSIWQVFATGLTACSNSIVAGGSMVVKINFAKESLVIASLAQALFDFLVRIGLLVVVFVILRVVPAWTTLLVPFALIPLLLFTLGLGLILSLLTALMRDIPHIVTLLTTFLLFLTPVLYPVPQGKLFAILNRYNPLSTLIIEIRNLVIVGRITEPLRFMIISLFCLFLFLVCWRIFHLVEPRMAERV
ncbi:MAG: ABC transporter permease [Candidatus Omnitrophota bacterium]|nr:MAG: ABC transporter permease [Candidatus Omnitrophota bacterium]